MMPNQPQPGESGRQRRARLNEGWKAEQINRGAAQDDKPAEPLVWQEMAVQVVHHDYLECKLAANGATYGVNINVAKPSALRRSLLHDLTVDGRTYDYTGVQTRTVSRSTGGFSPKIFNENQVITPKYLIPSDGTSGFLGSIIRAAPLLTQVKDDEDNTLFCQLIDITPRIYSLPLPDPSFIYSVLQVAGDEEVALVFDYLRAHD